MNSAQNESRQHSSAESQIPNSVDPGKGFIIADDVLKPEEQKRIYLFLMQADWSYGWRSRKDVSAQAFWHRHFAGSIDDADEQIRAQEGIVDCADELANTAPILCGFWKYLQRKTFQNHALSRCYANALPYGTDGGTHIDSLVPGDWTAVYYPHETWHPDWGGETIIFNRDCTDILAAVYPKPNRLFMFPGFVHHVARGVSRSCPRMRVTLMFKTRKAA